MRDGRKTVLHPIVALLLLNFMANAGGNTLETSGFEFRPAGREFSSILVAIPVL
jgi:hypothetical protein